MQFTSLILSNVEVSPGYWRMRMTAPPECGAARPGQFVMLRVNGAIDPLLRRPFGIFDIGTYTPAQSGAQPQPYLEMLYRVVGKGTAMLSTLHGSDLLDVLGPLGKGFDLGSADEEKLIVGFYTAQKKRLSEKAGDLIELTGDTELLDRAAWTAAARAVLNLDEMVTRE